MEIQSVASFLPYPDGIRERTLRIVRLVPDDKLGWRHTSDVFSVARHIVAVEPDMRRHSIA